jgi:hypothetical protein
MRHDSSSLVPWRLKSRRKSKRKLVSEECHETTNRSANGDELLTPIVLVLIVELFTLGAFAVINHGDE